MRVRFARKTGKSMHRSSRTFRLRQDRMKSDEQNAVAYENLPHARSVAHQISLLPPTMITANVIHS